MSKIFKIREECTEKPMLEMFKKGQREKGEWLRGLTDIQIYKDENVHRCKIKRGKEREPRVYRYFVSKYGFCEKITNLHLA